MVHVRRQRASNISPAVPSGRRIQPRWAAVLVAAVCAASLVALFSSHRGTGDATAAASVRLTGPDGAPAATQPANDPTPTGAPVAKPPARLGLIPDYNPDPDALRAPDAGSQPSAAAAARPSPPATPAVADQSTDRWSFLHQAATGEWLFLTGFLLLVLSIGGLVTVGIYRRRW